MKTVLPMTALLATLTLVACDKPTVVNVPPPAPAPVVAGPPGPAGAEGAKGETGKAGEGTTVVVVPPAPPASSPPPSN